MSLQQNFDFLSGTNQENLYRYLTGSALWS